jgi:hypothetical protein
MTVGDMGQLVWECLILTNGFNLAEYPVLYKPLDVSRAVSRLRWTLYKASDISKSYFKYYLFACHLHTPLESSTQQNKENYNKWNSSNRVIDTMWATSAELNGQWNSWRMALVTAESHVQWIRDKVDRSESSPLSILSMHNGLLPTHPPLV